MVIANLLSHRCLWGPARGCGRMLLVIIPFNDKFGANSIILFFIYKPISKWVKRSEQEKRAGARQLINLCRQPARCRQFTSPEQAAAAQG